MYKLIQKSNIKIFLIVLLMIMMVHPIDVNAGETTLSDVDSHWAKEYIHQLIGKGAINGYPDGTFRPDKLISRASFIKILTISLDLDIEKDTTFQDTANHWANGYIGTAIKEEIIHAGEYDELKFEPDKDITRIEIAQMLTRALGKESDALKADVDKLEFIDIDKINDNLKGYIVIMNQEGIILGYPDGRFGPDEHATRAEATAMIIRMLDSIINQEQEPITIGIFGTDERSTETARSDIIMIAKYFPAINTITLISVPRDTRVYIPKVKTDKINHAYSFGGATLLKETLENLFDTNIDYYVKMGFDDFKNIIDTFGGVRVNPKKDIYNWDDPDNILFNKGEQLLTGQQALAYVRFRNDSDGDFGRIRRQQEVIESLAYDVLQSKSILIIPKLISVFNKYTESDIKISELLSKLQNYKNIDQVLFDCYTLNTTSKTINGVWYEIVDEKDLAKLKELLNNE